VILYRQGSKPVNCKFTVFTLRGPEAPH
jgi:hypothetical protein